MKPACRLASVVVALHVCGGAGVAAAHHVVAEYGIAPVLPRTTVGVDAAAASFSLQQTRGSWQAVTAAAEGSLANRLSLFAALPVARVSFDGGSAYEGVGDASASLKASLYRSPAGALMVAGGFGVEMPTGDANRGLGGGHWELTPFVAASVVLSERADRQWNLYALASPRFAVGGAHAHGHGSQWHGSVLAPHAGREVAGRVMTVLVLGAAYVGAGGEGAAVFDDGRAHTLAVRSEAGYLLDQRFRLFAAVDASVAGEKRFGVRGRAGVSWFF